MIKEFIKKCNFDELSVIFEIGAHMGFDTEEIYNLTRYSKIFAFEPDPRNIKILKERNIDKIATIVEAAISNINSDSEIFYLSSGKIPETTNNSYYDSNDWSASNSLKPNKEHSNVWPWCKFEETIKVKTVTLDSFCKENNINHISFIWADVQGAEDLMFLGALEILKTTEYVYTEYSNQELYQDQKTQKELLELLPGKWMIRFDLGDNILLENIDYRTSLLSPTGYWKDKNMNEHIFDESLAKEILSFSENNNVKNIVDFGCGPGFYVDYFNNNGLNTEGYDGNPYTLELTNGKCDIKELGSDFDLGKKFDLVLSLEVAEHIPKNYQKSFINNLAKHTDRFLIISWGIPGQGGLGHTNCLENKTVKDIFESNGFINLLICENKLREAAENSWFKNTIMVFEKKENK